MVPGRQSIAEDRRAGLFPVQPLHHLDALWIQVAGTLCNLECAHCFVPSGPGVRRHDMLTREQVRARVAEGTALGAREFFLTGGEPFLHSEILEIVEDTLEHGPCTVLTNGTLFTRGRLEALRRLSDGVRYALEIRVSLDGLSAAEHDRIRGPGTFARTIDGLLALEAQGLLPIVTVTQLGDEDPVRFQTRALAALRAAGLARPRLKVIPLFGLGREAERRGDRAFAATLEDLGPEFDPHRLQCGSCRAVTSRGVFVCPLLVDDPTARMGDHLDQAMRPHELRHAACHTCWVTGMSCANA